MADKTVTLARKQGKRITRPRILALLEYDPTSGHFRWKAKPNGSIKIGQIAGAINTFGHRQITIDGRGFLAHRLAWFIMTKRWPKQLVDHKNRDPADNRWENLREATRAQNMANRRINKNHKVGLKGVSARPGGRHWAAKIAANGRDFWLGQFSTPEQAHAAYREAAARFHGEFARTE